VFIPTQEYDGFFGYSDETDDAMLNKILEFYPDAEYASGVADWIMTPSAYASKYEGINLNTVPRINSTNQTRAPTNLRIAAENPDEPELDLQVRTITSRHSSTTQLDRSRFTRITISTHYDLLMTTNASREDDWSGDPITLLPVGFSVKVAYRYRYCSLRKSSQV
jgi:hypothetical protein